MNTGEQIVPVPLWQCIGAAVSSAATTGSQVAADAAADAVQSSVEDGYIIEGAGPADVLIMDSFDHRYRTSVLEA